jgi:hypothetical protein
MLSIQKLLRSLRIASVFGVVLVGCVGLFSIPLAAQDAVDLTTLNDESISVYRWEAMASFYTMQPAVVDLTTLNDGEILTYRWEAMADYYAMQPALGGLTDLGDAAISTYRWQAMARFYAGQPDLAVVVAP